MAEVVNLRQARKAKARSAREKEANANRAAFGQSKAEKRKAGFDADRLTATLDGARRDPDSDGN